MFLAAGSSGGAGALGGIVVLVLLVAGAALYFLPTIIAAKRKVSNVGSVLVINLFLGWSLIGWVVALALAARSVEPPAQALGQRPFGPGSPI